jgi:hypothetical protein
MPLPPPSTLSGAANGAYGIFSLPFLIRLDASITSISIYIALTSLGPLVVRPVDVGLCPYLPNLLLSSDSCLLF